ncbi:MAG: hypothetical protein HXY50_13800 [Ignavibacteriaceae bacterium]|nr:hypothetical protein [Ignavibacteriaceae bacterium]
MFKVIVKLFAVLLFIPLLLSSRSKEIVGYFPQWKADDGKYYVKNIETSGAADKLTILNYAFAYPWVDSAGNVSVRLMDSYSDYCQPYTANMSIDGEADDSLQHLKGHFNQLRKLKEMHPHIKILISIGGWVNSEYFSDAVLTEKSRESFVNSCIEVFIKGNLPADGIHGGEGSAADIFDGIDLNWEFPVSGGAETTKHNQNDKINFSKLLALFREKLDEIDSDLLLTAAIPGAYSLIENFDIQNDQKYLNWYNVMTYDFSGRWSGHSIHHTNLLSQSFSDSRTQQNSFDKTVKILLNRYKVQPNKIIPGIAFYGKSYKLKSLSSNGLNEPCINDSSIAAEEFIQYREIISMSESKYDYRWDTESMAPYLVGETDSLFITFDDLQSAVLKSQYAHAYNLGGVMFWDLSGDDITGSFVNAISSGEMPVIKSKNEINVNENNPLKIVRPDNFSSFLEGSDIVIETEIKNQFCTVEFYVDDELIGRDTMPPYNWVWFNTEEGIHTLEARVKSSNSEFIRSLPITISIIKK